MTTLAVKDASGTTVYLEMTGTGTEIDPYRPVHTVADGGGSITVDGSVTVAGTVSVTGVSTETTLSTVATELGATNESAAGSDTATSGINGLLKRLLQRVTTLIGLFPTSLGQKAKTTSLAVTLASDEDLLATAGATADAAVTAGATGSISAKLRSISRDLVANIVLAAGSNTIGNTKDAGPSWTSVFGVSAARFTSSNQSASAASITDAPTSGQKIVVTDILVSVDTAMRVDFKEETNGTVIASLYLPANGSAQFTPRGKVKLATADKKLQVQTSLSGNIAVTAVYYSEA